MKPVTFAWADVIHELEEKQKVRLYARVFFLHGPFSLASVLGACCTLRRSLLPHQIPTGRVAADGSALLRQQGRALVPVRAPTVGSRGEAPARLTRGQCMLVTACCTDTASMAHQRLAHADDAALRTAGGARWARTRTRSRSNWCAPAFHRPPTSLPSTLRVGGSLPALSDPQGGSVVCSGAGLRQACA